MKKALIVFAILVIFFLFYFLQSNFFSWFSISGIRPNLFVILALFVGLYMGKTAGSLIGATCGIILDLYVGKNIGPTGIMLCIVGFLGGYFDNNFSKESKITIILMVLGTTIIYEVGKYLINIFLYNFNAEILPFIKILLIEILYQFIITIILYPIIKRVGYKIENVFKGNNIMTRYF